MDMHTGQPDHIEDYLCTVRGGQWFSWTNPRDKVYANLIVLNTSNYFYLLSKTKMLLLGY